MVNALPPCDRRSSRHVVVFSLNMTASIIVALLLTMPPARIIGQCPTGYTSERGWCVPMLQDAPVAVPKGSEPCPSKTVQSGAYCVMKRK